MCSGIQLVSLDRCWALLLQFLRPSHARPVGGPCSTVYSCSGGIFLTGDISVGGPFTTVYSCSGDILLTGDISVKRQERCQPTVVFAAGHLTVRSCFP